MSAKTPDTGTRQDIVMGNIRVVNAQFATCTANDTWNTGLSLITCCQATAGNAAAEVTISGGTVTFTNSATTYLVTAYGY